MRKRSAVAAVAVVVALSAAGIVAAVSANAAQGSYVQIVNAVSGKCADVAGASRSTKAPVHQWECHNDANQLWYRDDQGNGYARYVNKNSGLCLTNPLPSNSPIAKQVIQDECGFGVSQTQQWRWAAADEAGHLVLQSALSFDCLALDGVYSARNGWPIVMHACATTSGQFWHAG